MFADWSRITLPVASFSEEEVKEVKGLVVSPYTSLQFLELELEVRFKEPSLPHKVSETRMDTILLLFVGFKIDRIQKIGCKKKKKNRNERRKNQILTQ